MVKAAAHRIAVVLPLIALFGMVPLNAQQPDSGTINIVVQEPMGLVQGALIRADNRSATTDASGRARLVLRAGQLTLNVTRAGYVPKRVTVTVLADSSISLTI